jgi:MFS family permease
MSNTAEAIAGATAQTGAAPITPAYRKLVIASSLGSVIEHYDFFIYAFTAPIVFDRLFFPKMDSFASMLAVYATFAVGFVARPLGGMVFGHYGDQLGRKAMLTITFALMGVASFFIGCLPSYDSIGLAAPAVLVALRFVQGFAFGGEYMNAVSLTLENAPSARRGFFASWVNASGPIGVILASGFIALLGYVSSPQDFVQWVWRVPFVLSLLLVVLGTYIRLQVDESTLFKAVQASAMKTKTPLLDVMRSWKKSVLFGCLVNMAHSTFQYMSTVFVLGYAVKTLGMPGSSVTFGTMVANVLEMCMVPLIASYSDRFGRRPFIALGILLAAAWYPIYFQLVATKDPTLLILGLVVSIGIIHALMFAPEAAFTAELFPTEVRVSGSSLGKQLGIILGGGIAPLVGTALLGSGMGFSSIILYFEVIAACALVGIFLAPESAKHTL